MKKQRKQLLILIILLLVLIAGYFGIQMYNENQSNLAEESTSIAITGLSSEDIIEITYDYSGEENTFVLEEDTWKYQDDTTLNIEQARITSMATKLAQLSTDTVIENVTDMSQYGLDEPARTISFKTADSTYEIAVGDYNTMTSVYYIALNGGDTVYTIGSTSVSAFNYVLDDLIEEVEEEETAEEETAEEETVEEETSAEESDAG